MVLSVASLERHRQPVMQKFMRRSRLKLSTLHLAFDMRKGWLIIMLFVFAGCKQHEKNEARHDGVYEFATDDAAMNAAVAEAIRTYRLFEWAIQQPDTTMTDFAVKIKFGYDEGSHEHMWVRDLFMSGGQRFGILNSHPVYVENVQYGDTVKVISDSISDWMYVKNGKLVGGYTIKVIYENLNEKEKKAFRERNNYEIE